jgi:hypothetical protein
MKSSQKITRIQLKISKENEFVLVGLVSSEPDYILSQIINKKFRISLKNSLPVSIPEETGCELSFSRFSHTNESTGTSYSLFSNRSGNNFLLRKLRNVDYIFQLHDPENENSVDSLITALKDIEAVNAVFPIDLNTFKDKNLKYLIQ